MATSSTAFVMEARGLVKRYGHVTAMDGVDFELKPGEILAVIGHTAPASRRSSRRCPVRWYPTKARCSWTASR